MRIGKVLNLTAAAAVFVFLGAALAQDSAAPKTVDDAVARVLKTQPSSPAEARPAAPAAAPQTAPKAVPMVMDVRIGEHPDRTRFVVELSDPVTIRTFVLKNPNRVVIDLPRVAWKLSGPPRPSGRGAVRGYRYGPFRPGSSRFVIDLNKPVRMAEPMVIPPENGFGYRVVLDLFPTDQGNFDRIAGWPADLAARERAAARVEPQPKSKDTRRVVVLDPGHGGLDPGTIGIGGAREKDIVLAEAVWVKRALERRGYKVYMTRSTDDFVPLRERMNMARAWHADLFVSIHVDSISDPGVSGLSIYTLSERGSDKEAAALAAKENRSDIVAGVDLSGENADVAPILIDLAQRDTMNKSSRFAERLIAEVSSATNILAHRPHRSGALVVLKAPDVPSVLVELGYLSNRHDAAQMQTTQWRKKVADSIALAVDRHFTDRKQANVKSAP